MKLLEVSKDGGPESTVWAYWLVEIKWLFSVVLLRFENGTRDAYHDHAFNSVSWVLSGKLEENIRLSPVQVTVVQNGIVEHKSYQIADIVRTLLPSKRRVFTYRHTMHKVNSVGRTWVLSLRGPWAKTWREYDPKTGVTTTLTHGRVKQ